MKGRRPLLGLAALLIGCSAGVIAPLALSPTMVHSAEAGPGDSLKALVGTSWMYNGLWSSTRPPPSDPATARLRFPAEGKVEVVGPCGSEVGELSTVIRTQSIGRWQLVGTFPSAIAAECPGSPRQGIVGDLIRSGIDGSNHGIEAMFASNGHTFFEDTETGLAPLAGTSWDVESADGVTLAPLHWTVEFQTSGLVGGSDECNGFNGFYVTKGDVLRTSPVASTAIGCTSYSQYRRLFRSSGVTHFERSSNRLVITEEFAKYVLRPNSFGLPLAGTKWKATLRNQPVALAFLPESRARISTKCFSVEVPFTQRRVTSARYDFLLDFSSVATMPDKRICRVGFEILSTLQSITMRTNDSLVLRLGHGQPSLAESFQTRLTLELDTPVDQDKELAGTRWRMVDSSPPAAEVIEFHPNGTLKFQKQCGTWIYRITNGHKLEVQVKEPCKRRVSPLPFALPILHFIQSSDRKTLDLYNPVERRVAQYTRIR